MMSVRPLRIRLFEIVLVLLFAASLRLLGLSFGHPPETISPGDAAMDTLPDNAVVHPDEYFFVQRPLWMLFNDTLNPRFFENPSFLINLNLVTFALTGERSTLSWDVRADLNPRRQAPFRLYFIARTWSALAGVLAVAATYGGARVLCAHRGALVAALVVAVSLPMMQHAHYGTTSSLAAGFAAWSIAAALISTRRDAPLWFILAGIAAGLAAGNRYNAAAVSLVVFVIGWVHLFRMRRVLWWSLVGWIAFPLTFLFTTPAMLADPGFFWEQFLFITNRYIGDEQSPLQVSRWVGLYQEWRYLTVFGVGVPGMLLFFWGVWRAPRIASAALLAYLVPYTIVVLRTIRPISAEQMLLPIIPVVAIFIGVAVAQPIFERRTAWIAVLVLAYPLIATLSTLSLFMREDTRYRAQEAFYEHAAPFEAVLLVGPYNVPLDPARTSWDQIYGGADIPSVDFIREAGYEAVIVSDAYYRHFERAGFVDDAIAATLAAPIAAYDRAFERVITIPRPPIVGMRDPLHMPTYWHHPGIRIYCVSSPRDSAD